MCYAKPGSTVIDAHDYLLILNGLRLMRLILRNRLLFGVIII